MLHELLEIFSNSDVKLLVTEYVTTSFPFQVPQIGKDIHRSLVCVVVVVLHCIIMQRRFVYTDATQLAIQTCNGSGTSIPVVNLASHVNGGDRLIILHHPVE